MKKLLVPWALVALLSGALGTLLVERQAQPAAATQAPAAAPSPSAPWYCQSPAALLKFQQEYPTLGAWCP